jgi:acetylornithine deacetylase/succinyl-diaminopimelate desuccinylase-like protein
MQTSDFRQLAQWTVDQAITIQQIAAPTFEEQPRAAYVADQFSALGLTAVDIDDMFNVYGCLPGKASDQPGILMTAHTDTVFAAETDLTIRREGDLIFGPGLGDNSMGVAGMLAAIKAVRDDNLSFPTDLWFVATTREEGLGNLGGIRAAYDRLRNKIRGVINIEGLAFGHVYYAGISVRRLKISATTSGGHSWLHFGRPSATHAIVQLGARIAALQPPQSPRTTFNIGMIEGGTTINAIAPQACLWLDLRSEERSALNRLENEVRGHIRALEQDDLTFTVEVVGDRPAGAIPVAHPFVQAALTSLADLGVRASLEIGSTDANVPLSEGCPAVTVGITRGGNAHRTDEFVEVSPVALGLRHLLAVLITIAKETR